MVRMKEDLETNVDFFFFLINKINCSSSIKKTECYLFCFFFNCLEIY